MTIFTYRAPSVSVVLSSVFKSKEKSSYSYKNPPSNIWEGVEDYGSIAGYPTPPDTTEDFGLISDLTTYVSYGTIGVNGQNQTIDPFGTINISGSASYKFDPNPPENPVQITISGVNVEKRTKRYIGNGTITNITGSASYKFDPNPPENPVQITISGTKIEKRSNTYIGNGTITNITGSASYKFDPNPPENPVQITISGNRVERKSNTYIGSGFFSAFSGLAESVAFNYNQSSTYDLACGILTSPVTSIDDYGLITVPVTSTNDLGAVNVSESSIPFGTIFVSGNRVEKTTYRYSENSVVSTVTTEDYGTIAGYPTPPDTTENYGSIAVVADTTEDYGIIIASGKVPYGTINISGSALTKAEVQKIHTASGTINISGTRIEKRTKRYIGIGTINASGSSNALRQRAFNGTGTINVSGSARYKFNPNPPENPVQITISGSASYKFDPNPPENPVQITISGNRIENISKSYIGIGTINASGSSNTLRPRAFNGTGTINVSGSSIYKFDPNPPENPVQITISGSASYKFDPNPPENPVQITISGNRVERKTNSYIGIGTATVSGSASYKFDPNPPENPVQITISGTKVEKRSNTYIGIGTATVSGSASYKFDPNPPENPVQITISGTKIEKRSKSYIGIGTAVVYGSSITVYPYSYSGTGNIFGSGNRVEKTTYRYSEASISIGISPENYDDYGSIAGYPTPPDTTEDYGFIAVGVDTTEDYGSLSNSATPYGTINISGSARTKAEVESIHKGSGTINISGNRIEKKSNTYIGIGTAVVTGSASYNFDPNPPENPVQITISGNRIEKRSKIYIGIGTAVISGSASYKFDPNPPENPVQITISGTKIEKKSNTYIGIGTATVSGSSYTLRPRAFNGTGTINVSGSSIYKFDPNPPENPVQITISGSASYKFDPNPPENPVQITISGVNVEKRTKRYIGIGTATVSGSASYKFDPNPPENPVQITISGTKVEKRSNTYIGIGTATVSGSASYKFDPNPPENPVQITISGTKIEKRSKSYIGSGFFSAFSGLAESVAFNYNQSSTYDLACGILTSPVTSIDDYGLITVPVTSTNDLGAVNVSESSIPFGTIFVSGNRVEKTTYRYSEQSVVSTVIIENYGSIAAPVDTTEDYGSIDAVEDTTEDYGIIIASGKVPYGTINISGSASTKAEVESIHKGSGTINISGSAFIRPPLRHIASGTINASGSARYKFNPNPPENPVQITISGTKVEKRSKKYIGNGTITNITGSASYKFDPNPPENPVQITISGANVEKRTKRYIGIGTINASGSSNTLRQRVFNGSGTINVSGSARYKFNPNPPENPVQITISGSASYKFDPNPPENPVQITISGTKIEKRSKSYIGSGFFSAFSGLAESVAFNYNQSSTYDLACGILTSPVTSIDDYGLITVKVTSTNDLGAVNVSESATPFGTIFVSGNRVEKKTYRYSENSVVSTVITEDYGTIALYPTPPDTTEDYGSIDAVEDITEDYGIIIASGKVPYGTINISGSASTKVEVEKTYTVSGTINISGNRIEKRSKRYIGIGTATVSGSSYTLRPRAFNGTGTINVSGSSIYKFDPNPPENPVQITISGSASYKFDPNPPENPVQITISGNRVERKTKSYIGIGTAVISGSASYKFDPNPPENPVQITISGTKIEKKSNTYIGIGTAVVTGSSSTRFVLGPKVVGIGTINISGSALIRPPSRHIASGTINASGSASYKFDPNPPENPVQITISGTKKENRTFRYSESVTVLSVTITDFGLITNSATFNDLGLITDSLDRPTIDAGAPPLTSNYIIPYGTINVSGSAINIKQSHRYIGVGTVAISGSARIVTPYKYKGSGTINVSGSAITQKRTTSIIVGFGTENISGTQIQKRVFNYNQSSITGDITTEDYGSIAGYPTPPDTTEDYGSISVGIDTSEDYGSLIIPNRVPYGTINISGSIRSLFDPVKKHRASGTINISGSASNVKFTSGAGESTLLGTISGSASYKFDPNPPENPVQITISGTKIEKRSKIYIGIGTATVSGSAEYSTKLKSIHKGSGTINVSGSAKTRYPHRYVGIGTLFAISGSSIAFGANPPENILLGTISGTKVESRSYTHKGSGSINISGTATKIKLSHSQYGSGTINVSGSAKTRYPNRYVGIGTLFAISGSSIAFGANPPENILLGTISGTKVEKRTKKYIGIGTARVSGSARLKNTYQYNGSGTINVSGSAKTRYPHRYVGIGNITISGRSSYKLEANPPENILLGTISGTKVEKRTKKYIGIGTARVSGSVRIIAPRKYTASGTINVSGSASYKFDPNPPENSVQITISGTKIEKRTKRYVGIGNITISGRSVYKLEANPPENIALGTISGSANTRHFNVFTYRGSGSVSITGTVSNIKIRHAIVGVGRLSAIAGSANVFGANPPENIVLLNILGKAKESYTRSTYIASGITTIFGADIDSTNPYIPPFIPGGTFVQII